MYTDTHTDTDKPQMWELAAISLIVLLLVLILVIVACWITTGNSCRKNRRQLDRLEVRLETGMGEMEAALAMVGAKAALTVSGSVTLARQAGAVHIVTWESRPHNELPDGAWAPAFSSAHPSPVGWSAPAPGTYRVHYSTAAQPAHASSTSTASLAALIVNGQLLRRSVSLGCQRGQLLSKTFLVNLQKRDVLALALVAPALTDDAPIVQSGSSSSSSFGTLTNNSPQQQATRHRRGEWNYAHGLTVELMDASLQATDRAHDALSATLRQPSGEVDLAGGAKASQSAILPSRRLAEDIEAWAGSQSVTAAIAKARAVPDLADYPYDILSALEAAAPPR